MDFAALPPEVNSARMYSGSGAGTLLAAATAWETLASELHSAGTQCESVIAELGGEWTGPSSTVMTTAVTPYVTWLHATAVQAGQAATQARAAAAAYEAAFVMTVPPPAVTANRSQLATLLQTNIAGQNTAAIAAIEAQYAEMWAQDAIAMYHYAGNAATASILKPFSPPPQTTNPAGSTSQAAAAGQAAAGSAAGQAQNAVSQLAATPNALQSMTAPAAAATGASSTGTSAFGSALAPAASVEPALALAYAGFASSLFGTFIIDGAGTFGVDVAGSFGIDLIGVGEIESELPPFGTLMSSTAPVTAGVGEAAEIGGMSVPPAWTIAAPEAVQYIGSAAPAASAAAEAAPAASGGAPAIPFAEMGIAGAAGRALAVAGRGRGGSGSATKKPPETGPQPSRNGPVTAIADELRELAELRDSGILTDEEFADQKRRLLGP